MLAASTVAFVCYGYDKWRARAGGWRVSEAMLQMLALAGGWPGAWLGQRAFRHKTGKPGFRRIFLLAALLNLLVLWGLASVAQALR
ncbi:DUF1294 domain-containing protein [Jeongeupia naejangsanensis]|uniref:DUF1294 domain-containing protein n=2 Tax=Jeongeupia naejangsanensis TaxID=613195 RepID=A0ABS2BJM6_9NEIS|nr:DUF1294 domain-containing protein [Jeongeupia naejangsanensis]